MPQSSNRVSSGVQNTTQGQNRIESLKVKIQHLTEQKQKYYNESHYYKNKCLELMEKLQIYQENENGIESKILRRVI